MQPGADGTADRHREKKGETGKRREETDRQIETDREIKRDRERGRLTPGSVFCSWRAFWALMADSLAQ